MIRYGADRASTRFDDANHVSRIPELLDGKAVGYRFHFDKDVILRYERLTEPEIQES